MDRWASTQSLQPHGCHGVLDVQQGQPIAQRGEWIGTEGSWTKSLATILGDVCKKHDGNFWRTRFCEIEVYLSSRFLPYFPFGIPWFEQITAGHAVRTTSPRLTSPHLTLSNTTRALGVLRSLKKKQAPRNELDFWIWPFAHNKCQ